jgi:hypothetical protein
MWGTVAAMPDQNLIDLGGFADSAFEEEVRHALQAPLLSALERARIHARALDMAAGHEHLGLRRAWPQLAQLGAHPAVVGFGGAAAAVLAVAGLVALRERRGHAAASVLRAA